MENLLREKFTRRILILSQHKISSRVIRMYTSTSKPGRAPPSAVWQVNGVYLHSATDTSWELDSNERYSTRVSFTFREFTTDGKCPRMARILQSSTIRENITAHFVANNEFNSRSRSPSLTSLRLPAPSSRRNVTCAWTRREILQRLAARITRHY